MITAYVRLTKDPLPGLFFYRTLWKGLFLIIFTISFRKNYKKIVIDERVMYRI